MKYNLLTGALWEVNTTEGNVSLDFSERYNLVEYGDDPVVTLSGSSVLAMDFDFGHRIHLYSFSYKFDTIDAAASAVASGVKFYYRNETLDSYTELPTYVSGTNTFYTAISGDIFAPRYIRMVHTVSGTYGATVTSGSVYGFRALNNDSIVGFGQNGNETETSVETARGSEAVVEEVAIYNSGTQRADAYVNLEPQYTNIDSAVSISNNLSGPWTYALDTDYMIMDSTTFDYGSGDTLTLFSEDVVGLDGVIDAGGGFISKEIVGSYTTRIFEKDDANYCRYVVSRELNRDGNIKVNKNDAVETIQIRSSNTKPKPYAIFRELRLYNTLTTAYIRYTDKWFETQTIKEESSWNILSTGRFEDIITGYETFFDLDTERWAGYIGITGTDSRAAGQLFIFNNVGTSTNVYLMIAHKSSNSSVNFSWRELKLDYLGGMWVYFFCQSYDASEFVDASGYFLAYFDSDLNNTFKWYSTREEIGSLYVNYNSRDVWYTIPETGRIYKVTSTGSIEVNYIDEDTTGDLGGIAVLSNDYLLYANGQDLHQLKNTGIYYSDGLMEDVAEDKISYIALDGDGSEAIWVIDGQYVGYLYMSGENKGAYAFRVLVDYPIKLTAVEDGVWVHCGDVDAGVASVMKYISKENRKVDISYTASNNGIPGLLYRTHNHVDYISSTPISIDTLWSSLAWSTVPLESYLTSEDGYYQLKIFLRRQEPIERYPEFITDATQGFLYEDDFDQTSTTPNKLLWGYWRDQDIGDGLDRVYVDTGINGLQLVNGGAYNAYINTKQRTVYSRGTSNLEIRIDYKIGAGNGAASGVVEKLYVSLYSVQLDKYVGGYLYIPTDPSSSAVLVYGDKNGDTDSNSYGTTLNAYEGTIQILWNSSDSFSFGWRTVGSTGSFFTKSFSVTSTSIGDYFYLEISSDSNGSSVLIKNVDLYSGDPLFYTDTPMINAVYRQELVKIEDIYPNNYKNVYVRTYISPNLEVESYYDMDMKVRWRVPVD